MSKYDYGSAAYRNALSTELLLRRLQKYHGVVSYPVPAVIVENPLLANYRDALPRKLAKCSNMFGKVTVAVCHEFGIKREDLVAAGFKKQTAAFPRQVAMHLLATEGRLTEPTVGRYFQRDPTCVRLAKKKIPKMESENRNFARRLRRIKTAIRSAA